MFCQQCGKEVKDGVKFCENCGWAVPIAPAPNVQPVVLPSATPTAMPPNQNTGFVQTIAAEEKFCSSCGSVIKKIAEICPKCGVNQSMRSGTSAVTVYCSSCGKTINREAATCPFCGVSQGSAASGTGDKKGPAIAALVLGINSLWTFLFPFLGFPVSVVGVIMGIVGYKSSKRGMALAGIILSIIGFVATIINMAVGATLGATGQLF